MGKYFFRRFLLIAPTFIGVTMLVFTVTRFVPGGPIERMINQANAMETENGGGGISGPEGGSALSEEQIEELKKYYGFDLPIWKSYYLWLKKVITLDLGTSTRYNEPVWDIIKERFPISIFYGLVTMFLTYAICIPLGVLKAIKHGTKIDNITSIIVFVGYAIPGYVVGIILLIFCASYMEWFPLGGFKGDEFEDLSFFGQVWDIIWHSILPLIAYMMGSFAVMTFMMKNSLMDNLSSDYMRTAMAKGVSFRKSITGHALRNSLIPLATHFGNNLSVIFTGSFLIETIFNIDGFGLLGYESLVERDYPVVLGTLVLTSLIYLIGNILSDVCVALVDPRVKFQ